MPIARVLRKKPAKKAVAKQPLSMSSTSEGKAFAKYRNDMKAADTQMSMIQKKLRSAESGWRGAVGAKASAAALKKVKRLRSRESAAMKRNDRLTELLYALLNHAYRLRILERRHQSHMSAGLQVAGWMGISIQIIEIYRLNSKIYFYPVIIRLVEDNALFIGQKFADRYLSCSRSLQIETPTIGDWHRVGQAWLSGHRPLRSQFKRKGVSYAIRNSHKRGYAK